MENGGTQFKEGTAEAEENWPVSYVMAVELVHIFAEGAGPCGSRPRKNLNLSSLF